MIRFGPEICRDLDAAQAREWLETNGLGGFASATVCGANTRRYHGLLIAATRPPLGRMVLLSKVEEVVTVGNARFELACNFFENGVFPRGQLLLEEFRLDPWPVWRWNLNGVRIEKSVCMLQGEDTVIVEYRLPDEVEGGVSIELRPLIACRDYHSTAHANSTINRDVLAGDGSAVFNPYPGAPAIYFSYGNARLSPTGDWYNHFVYPRERERGLDFSEDLFQPFALRHTLRLGEPLYLIASTQNAGGRDAEKLRNEERTLRRPSSTQIAPALERASAQFFAARGEQTTVLAGYHWFTDWGRDTMISLPGLALTNGKPELARRVLLAFLPWIDQGLLPNRFPDAGEEPEYNSTDATLWFVEAVRAYVEATGDLDFVRQQCMHAFHEIVEWRERGTLYNIRLDTDGLLSGGAPGVQLTWMDAKVNGRVITPREGKPVEIQALWYNALIAIAEFMDGAFAAKCRALAGQARAGFHRKFWNEAERCLFDVVHDDGVDAAIRPNQVFALSLKHPILDLDRGPAVLDTVRRELLTPFGLRTLSPRDSRYRGRFEGGPESRDGAYHQGTVWPWLLGPYVKAMFAVYGKTEETLGEAKRLLQPFEAHLLDAGLGQISEVFDGDDPQRPGGCIAQAWSVAELLTIARGV